jgi:predicted O-methyltransferase YrrM
MKKHLKSTITFIFCYIYIFTAFPLQAQPLNNNPELDKKVSAFLKSHSGTWADMNVPKIDGQLLYDIIIKNNYKSALEIGTSTGHSSIWIAWALSKTGGKLITVEIDKERYKKALNNFKEAGLEEYINARLADAHDLVPQLEGPFDFVFCDADKHWYKNYFLAVDPKLEVKGCYTTHNVSESGRRYSNTEYLNFLKQLPHYETTVNDDGNGMSISYKKLKKVDP